ncbi:MAG: hypothetical protein IPM74_11865 [Crocinitomicaceae bacterium]|nr:hypothetical protein [Crocinitomicaceae bacterium]MBK8926572.1 hypothetical protein [Crocinitomicaceae bacterium]
MKKVALALVVVASAVVFTSCKKDYVCTCSGTVLGIPYSGADTTLADMTKKDAESKCDSFEFSIGSDSQTCELK